MKKRLLLGFGLLGILLFTPLFIFTFLNIQIIENSAQSFIQWELKNELNKTIDSINLPHSKALENFLNKNAKNLQTKTQKKLTKLKQELKDNLPSIIATQMAKMYDLNCECREKWEERLRASIAIKITTLENEKEILADFAQAKYMQIITKLTKDVRIFLGVNSFVFIFLLLLSFLKPSAIEHLFLPASLLLISSLLCSYFYLFEQNWLYTILYNSYTGFAYLSYLLIVFLFLCDIIFNKARLTTKVINFTANVLGSAFSVVPC